MVFENNISISKVTAKVVMTLLFIATCLTTSAQQTMVRQALKALQAEDLETAKGNIDSAAVHEETKDSSSTWYYRGFIYKKVYNNTEKSNRNSSARGISVESFKIFLELDKKSELFETAYKSVKYLASTYYNDAANALTDNPEGYELAIINFGKHKQTMLLIEPNHDFRSLEKQFYLVLGQVYNQLYEGDREKNISFYEKTEDAYKLVLGVDSNNLSANYNLAILYYNEGVNIIKNLDYDLDLITLTLIQDEVVVLFQRALPYAERAYLLNPCRKETLIMLSGIYFSLNEMEKSQQIQMELEGIEKIGEYKGLLKKVKGMQEGTDEFNNTQIKIKELIETYSNINYCAGIK